MWQRTAWAARRGRGSRSVAREPAIQGHRDQALGALGQTPWANDLLIRSAFEAALGDRERAMELLRQHGSTPGMQGIHAGVYWLRSMRDYPPFQEFFGMTE